MAERLSTVRLARRSTKFWRPCGSTASSLPSASVTGNLSGASLVQPVGVRKVGDLTITHLGGDVGEVDRHALRKLDLDLRVAVRRRRFTTEQPARETPRILEPDAAVRKHPRAAREIFLMRRVVEENVEIVGEGEFQVA